MATWFAELPETRGVFGQIPEIACYAAGILGAAMCRAITQMATSTTVKFEIYGGSAIKGWLLVALLYSSIYLATGFFSRQEFEKALAAAVELRNPEAVTRVLYGGRMFVTDAESQLGDSLVLAIYRGTSLLRVQSWNLVLAQCSHQRWRDSCWPPQVKKQ